jgi:H+/Cl- antiporter ClcA
MPRDFITEYRLEISALLSFVFGLLSVIGLIGARYINIDGKNVTFKLPSGMSFLLDLIQPFGTWVTWIAIIAPIGFIVCIWWLYDYIKKARKLASLMDTPSRAKFVRNMDDIEYLAWVLPKRFEKKVIEKKREFKL